MPAEETSVETAKKTAKRSALSMRQRAYVDNVMDGMKPKEAALAAGYAPVTAANVRVNVAEQPAVKETFREVMQRVGMSNEELAAKLAAGLDAKKTIYATYLGQIGDSREVPDNQTQAKHLEIALKIAGHLREGLDVTHTVSLDGKGFERMLGRVRGGVFGPETIDVTPEPDDEVASEVASPTDNDA